ncbi:MULTISPECIES: hypothetical protein [unclassified Streptomyces]|uniref:hypothetical protein n=1 Tax=unclassified Streptomyces TaxID=2593676 RepID=UPI0009393A1D|nr:hypothetical protein [Streptomyces sp. TSRI0281]
MGDATMGQEQQLITRGMAGGAEGLVQRVRGDHPSARELERITEAYAAHSGIWHRLWLDDQAGVLVFLASTDSGNGAGGLKLHEVPLCSASCTRVLTDLTTAVLLRLASPADSYQARCEADRDIGALVQLFRVRLAQMRCEYPDGAELVKAIRAQIERAGDEQQVARRTAFLGWYLEGAYGDDVDGLERAERDLRCGIEPGISTYGRSAARTVMAWSRFRDLIRCQVPQPRLDEVPSQKQRRRGSIHWYYEFRTIGRHLTEHQMLELRAQLPWADVTSDSLVLDEWSHHTEHPVFRAAGEIVSQYFDVGLHFSQEGSRTLWLRLPSTLSNQIAPYEDGFGVRSRIVDDGLVLELHREEADGELSYLYHDPRPWLGELLPLRGDLADGDVRAPAIAWRAANETLTFTKASKRPSMPDGLDEDELNPQLRALIRLLEEIP